MTFKRIEFLSISILYNSISVVSISIFVLRLCRFPLLAKANGTHEATYRTIKNSALVKKMCCKSPLLYLHINGWGTDFETTIKT